MARCVWHKALDKDQAELEAAEAANDTDSWFVPARRAPIPGIRR